MKRDELLEIVREEIFEKMHEFNYINMDIRIPDDVFGDKSVDELTVGIFVDMLYDWLESK